MRKYTKKPLSLVICLLLIGMIVNADAVLPPKYLAIKDFQQCLGTKDIGTWSAWCMPDEKPASCPDESWSKLGGLTGKDQVPNC